MDIVSTEQKKRIHPHKFTLWVAIGSILMMFAGLTSAFIVKSNQTNWISIDIPLLFWLSTAVILVSSLTIHWSVRSFKLREMRKYRLLVAVTLILGLAFIALQWMGFQDLWRQNITFRGSGAGQFLYVIFGLHAIHVLGGVIALLVIYIRAFMSRMKIYSSISLEVAAAYWHFVDLLWIYLLVFFLIIG